MRKKGFTSVESLQYFLYKLVCFLKREKIKSKMSSSGASQSQATYSMILEQKPPIEVLLQKLQSANQQTQVSKCMVKLADYMRNDQDTDFQTGLKGLSIIFEKGYSSIFMVYPDLMRKMMNHFTKLGKKLEVTFALFQDQQADQTVQIRMLYVLSIIAELIRENSKFYFPFTRKFLLTVFRIDDELLVNSPKKKDILAILAVIYENLSRQGRLVNKYSITDQLKRALLQNYQLIQELFTLKVFNKAIANLVTKGVNLSVADFTKHKILETLSNFIEKNQVDLFVIKLKMSILSQHEQGQKAQTIQHTNSAFCMTE